MLLPILFKVQNPVITPIKFTKFSVIQRIFSRSWQILILLRIPLSLNQAIDEQFWSTQYSVKENIQW
jgi:hypothetical protein